MPKIVIDVRRIRDFGIGTYIRNLIHALAAVDRSNRYVLVAHPADAQLVAALPSSFETAFYHAGDSRPAEHIAFPLFLRRFSATLGARGAERERELLIGRDLARASARKKS